MMIDDDQKFIPPKPIRFTTDQADAIKKIIDWIFSTDRGLPKILSLVGAAGTGKTTLMRALDSELMGSHINVAWSAMTGKAAYRLRESAGVPAKTLHSLLYFPPSSDSSEPVFSQIRPPEDVNLLVCDEASMMTPSILKDLDQWIKRGVKILLVGDSFQLPPICSKKEEEEHGKDYNVFNIHKGPELSTIIRNDDGIISVATDIREKGIIPTKSNESYNYINNIKSISNAINGWIGDPNDHIMITWTNKLRMQINEVTRERLGITENMPQAHEPILVCTNGQNCLNGEIYTVEDSWEGPHLEAFPTVMIQVKERPEPLFVAATGKEGFLDGNLPYIQNWRQFKKALEFHGKPRPIACTYGYAVTAHKAQGSEFRRVSILLAKSDLGNPHFCTKTKLPSGAEASLRDRWIYTAVTRARKICSINIA